MAWNAEKFFLGSPLFRGVPRELVVPVAQRARRLAFKKGGFIFHEGQPAEWGSWVETGFIKIAKGTSEGRLVTMEILTPGDVFAPAGIMPIGAYPANAVAVSAAWVVQAARRDLAALAKAFPDLLQMVLAQVSERLRHAHSLRALDAESAEKRVAATLLWLHQKTGGVLTISRKEIAEIAGVAPETASRTVLAFNKDRKSVV